jgi:hypothetical protein
MTDVTNATVNETPIEDTSTSVESTVDNTEATETRSNDTREIASKIFDKLTADREQNTDASKGKTDHSGLKALPTTPGVKAEPAQQEIDPVTGRALEPVKAPSSWTPSLREKWTGIPRDVQKFITDRERDMSTTLSKTADERKAAKEWNDATSPYGDFCKQFNTTPVQHASELLNMSRALNTGNAQQKAQILHNLIMHFKPDFAIMQALSNGQQVNVQPAQQQPVDIDAEVAKRIEQQNIQRQEQESQSVIEKFASDPANEFYSDVHALMGKAIDGGFVQGNDPEQLLKDAYEFACQNHPEVKAILATRVTAPVSKQKQPVKSVTNSLGASTKVKVEKQFKTTRDAALAAWDLHSK